MRLDGGLSDWLFIIDGFFDCYDTVGCYWGVPCRRVPRGLDGGSLVLERARGTIALALGMEAAGDFGLVTVGLLGGSRAVTCGVLVGLPLSLIALFAFLISLATTFAVTIFAAIFAGSSAFPFILVQIALLGLAVVAVPLFITFARWPFVRDNLSWSRCVSKVG